MFARSLLYIFLIASFALSCRTLSPSDAKDLQITDPKGKILQIDEELLSAEIYSGDFYGKVFFTGTKFARGKFIFENKDGDRSDVETSYVYNHHAHLRLDHDFYCKIDYGWSALDGSAVKDERNIICHHPLTKSIDGYYKNILMENLIGRSPKEEQMKLCFRDDTCDVAIDWTNEKPRIRISVTPIHILHPVSGKKRHMIFTTPSGDALAYMQMNASFAEQPEGVDPTTTVLCKIAETGIQEMNNGLKFPDGKCIVGVNDKLLGQALAGQTDAELLDALDQLLSANTLKVKYIDVSKDQLRGMKLGSPFDLERAIRSLKATDLKDLTLSR